MNLPTSQTTPDKFYDLPPKQRRNLRALIKNASPEEIAAFLHDDVQPKSGFHLKSLLLLLVSSAVFAAAILTGSIPLLLVVVLSAPFAAQMLNLSLSAVIPSYKHFWRGLLGTLITALFYFGSGLLAANLAGKHWSSSGIPLAFLKENGVQEGIVLTLAVILFAWHCLSQKELPRLSSALMSILIFGPFGLAGWMAYGSLELAGEALFIYCLPRLAWSFLLSLLIFWVAGLPPRHVKGWLIFLLAVALFAVSIVGYQAYGPTFSHSLSYSSQVHPPEVTETQPIPTPKPSNTRPVASPSATAKPTSTPAPTATATLTPTPVVALVNSETGVRMRAEADPNAEVLAYLNNLSEVALLGEEKLIGNTLWQKVRAPDGQIGWIVSQYLITATPSR